ncbi:TcfC E-set like domain-containing protein [Vibrio metschnikovii]|nr:TcfC E-set like domain-containing protein [Vibrio metschnikovii]
MKKNKLLFILSGLVIFSLSIQAGVPESFKSLYEFKDKKVRVSTLNDRLDRYISFSTNYDSVKLPIKNRENSRELLQLYLEESNVEEEIIRMIIQDLEKGIKSDKSCRGKLSECIVTPKIYSFVYDYDENYLRLFINNRLFNNKINIEKNYASEKNTSNALINSNDIYFSSYNDKDTNYTINNRTLLGLSLGHLTADLSYSNSRLSKGIESKELSYDVTMKDKRLYLGKFKNSLRFNATDFLSTNTRYQQTSINFGSSKNLLVGERGVYEKLFYYSPSSGELIIYRDNIIIKQLNIGEGQGSISYSDLPSGRYEVTVNVVVSGQLISSELVQIYNTSRDTLAVGDVDYLFSAGIFNGNSYGQSTYTDNFENKFFTKGLISSHIINPLVIGFGGLYSGGEWAAIMGTQLYLPYQFTLDMKLNYFNYGSYNFDGSISNGLLSLRHENFSIGNNEGNFAQYIYSDGEYSRSSLTGNYHFSNGIYTYAVISKGKQAIREKFYATQDSYSYWSVTSGINITLGHGINLGISIDYQDSNNNVNTLVNLSAPLGSGYSSSSFLSINNNIGQVRNSLNKNDVFKNKEVNSQLSISQNYYSREEDKNTIDTILTANTKKDQWQGSAYAYADSVGQRRGISGNLSSNQIFHTDSILFTSNKSDAYSSIDVNSSSVKQDTYGYVTMYRNGKLNNKSFLYDDKTLYPLNSYNQYEIKVDTESVSLINLGDSEINEFVKPGSIVRLNLDLRNILSFVGSFEDVMGEKVKDLLCKGSGCHEVQKITDGVFQVSLMEGLDFELYSDNNTCIIPENKVSKDILNFGRNYCLPNIQPMEYILVNVDNKESLLYFIGLFDSKFDIAHVTKLLNDNNITSIIKNVGKYKAVYITMADSELDYAKLSISNNLLNIVNIKNIQELSIKDLSLSSIRSNNL